MGVAWSQEDWDQQMNTQAEEVAITEEDLELIRERETNIRQLEVGLTFSVLHLKWYILKMVVEVRGRGERARPIVKKRRDVVVVLRRKTHTLGRLPCLSVRHHGCEPNLQGSGGDDPRPGGDDWWVAQPDPLCHHVVLPRVCVWKLELCRETSGTLDVGINHNPR